MSPVSTSDAATEEIVVPAALRLMDDPFNYAIDGGIILGTYLPREAVLNPNVLKAHVKSVRFHSVEAREGGVNYRVTTMRLHMADSIVPPAAAELTLYVTHVKDHPVSPTEITIAAHLVEKTRNVTIRTVELTDYLVPKPGSRHTDICYAWLDPIKAETIPVLYEAVEELIDEYLKCKFPS